MVFKLYHNNINVFDLDKSLDFYREAFHMEEVRRSVASDGSYIIVFLQNKDSSHMLELTWLRDKKEPYNLGDNEIHFAFQTDDYDAAFAKHKAMDCICYINEEKHLYFVSDPDGYWIEIVPMD